MQKIRTDAFFNQVLFKNRKQQKKGYCELSIWRDYFAGTAFCKINKNAWEGNTSQAFSKNVSCFSQMYHGFGKSMREFNIFH